MDFHAASHLLFEDIGSWCPCNARVIYSYLCMQNGVIEHYNSFYCNRANWSPIYETIIGVDYLPTGMSVGATPVSRAHRDLRLHLPPRLLHRSQYRAEEETAPPISTALWAVNARTQNVYAMLSTPASNAEFCDSAAQNLITAWPTAPRSIRYNARLHL